MNRNGSQKDKVDWRSSKYTSRQYREMTDKIASVIAGLIIGLVIVTVWLLLINWAFGYDKTDKMAQCGSLGGVWSTQSDSCWYGGQQKDINDIKKGIGL